jgi:hypothetical protein
MSDELLARAASALRDEHDGASDAAFDTRERIVATAQQARIRRRRTFVVLPLLAAFVASAAWATETGRLARLVSAISRAAHGAAVVAPAPRASGGGARLPAPPARAAAPVQVEPLSERAAAAPGAPPPERVAKADAGAPGEHPKTAASTVERRVGRRSPRASETSEASIPPSVESPPNAQIDPNELYREAHAAHFVLKDPAAALAAWDRYLAAAPNGAFAVEARYNRAIALVRLGRTAEAAQALRPFAAGDYGAYRKVEAQRLLDRLTP